MAGTAQNRQRTSSWAWPFYTIWTGQALSLIGSGLAGFALVWWLTVRTGSATVLATASLVQLLPGVFLGPFAGALVDRWNRRKVMMVADSVIALFSAWLALLFWTGAMQIWHVYVIMFVRALGGAFHWSAMQASTSLMVPQDQLARVAGVNQTLHGVLNIVSPPLGALLIALLPLYGLMVIDVLTAVFAIVPLFYVHIPQPEHRATSSGQQEAKGTLWQDVREGVLYLWHWPGMFAGITVATVFNLLVNPGFSLVPILVTKHFGGDALQLGWMNAAWGAGVVSGGLTLSVWGGFRRKILTTLMGLLGISVGVLVVGFSPSNAFWLAWAGMFLAGYMNPIANGPFFAILQDVVAPEIQGRVFTVVGSVSAAAAPLGMLIAGPVADRWGVQLWFILGGIAGLLMGIAMPFMRGVMNLEDYRAPVKTGEPASSKAAV